MAILAAWLITALGIAAAAAPAAAAEKAPGYQQLHAFEGEGGLEGFGPYGALIQASDGNLYGTAFYGGKAAYRCLCLIGGTVFRSTTRGNVTVLHEFSGADGIAPSVGLTLGTDGLLYGMTRGGGAYNGGTAFKIDTKGNFTLLHSFGGPANDGADPYLGALLRAPDGNFYGATTRGGSGKLGVVFMMTPAGDVTVLHSFAGGATDGSTPRGGLMLASDGNLYGTTLCGGAHEAAGGCSGTIYRITPKGQFDLVYSFDPSKNGGYAPQSPPTEVSGMLYGTTTLGGSAGAGIVYQIPVGGGTFSVLHAFAGGLAAKVPNSEGMAPVGALALAADGRLYGTTSNGGTYQVVHPDGDGTIFSIGTDGSYTTIYSFGASATDGSHPIAALFASRSGVLYGSTETDGTNFTGTIFSWTPTAP